MEVALSGLRARGPVFGCDLIRLGAFASVLVALLEYGAIAGALFFLVLGGTMIPRALGAPAALDAAYCLSVLGAGWAAVLDWYLRVAWLDVAVHAIVTGLVAAMVHLLLVRVEVLPPVCDPVHDRVHDRASTNRRPGAAVATTALGASLAVVWELGEWFGHTYLDSRIQVGHTDTVGDLVAGAVGAAVAGVLLARGMLLTGAHR